MKAWKDSPESKLNESKSVQKETIKKSFYSILDFNVVIRTQSKSSITNHCCSDWSTSTTSTAIKHCVKNIPITIRLQASIK